MILFGMTQPALQTKKIKWKDTITGEMKEEYRISWYRKKVDEIDQLMQKITPYIIRTPGMNPPWRYTKNDQMDVLPQKVAQLTKEIRTFVWQLYFDMASVGLTIPRSDDPSTSLQRSQ
jgi:hypothetical protein